MKTGISFLIIITCGILFSNSLLAQDSSKSSKIASFSFGFGIPFGGQGLNVELYPVEYCGINLGFGDYGSKVIAFSGGFRILFPNQSSPVRFLAAGHFGTVGSSKEKLVIKKVGAYFDWSSAYAKPKGITGTALSLGIRIQAQTLIFQNIDIGVILKRNYELSNDVEEIKPWFEGFFVGTGFYF